MRALVCNAYGPPDSLSLEAVAEPTPGPRQVVINVTAAGVNFPDVLVIAGKYQDKTPLPFVPGNEVAGVVSAVGDGVTEFAVGQNVIATCNTGAFAEKCVADEGNTFPMPRELNFDQGAGFPIAFCTSWHAFRQCADLKSGETVLVLGAAGGVGTTAVEIAKAASIIGVWWGPWSSRNPAMQRRNVQELLAHVRAGSIRPRITASYPADEFRSAFADIVERRVRGKVVLRFRDSGTGSG